MNRRAFIRQSMFAATATIAGCAPFQTSQRMPSAASEWQKHGVILEATEPWEGKSIQNFTSSIEPLAGDAWRLWYSVSDEKKGYRIAFAEGVPGEQMRKIPAAISPHDAADGEFSIGNVPANWRLVQPTHIRMRDGRHRLYFWAHGPQVARYLAAESDDGRRYHLLNPLKPVLYHPNDRAAFGVPSPDGVMYRTEKNTNRPHDEPLAVSRLVSNDATTIYQLADGSFEMYSVALVLVPKDDPAYIREDNAPGKIRVIDRYTSGDGIHFEQRQRVIQRDANDPADQQFYYLSVTHTPRGRIGMLGHYRCQAQTMDLEWCFSPDGIQWERPRREGWLARGLPPAPDCYGIYGGNRLVEKNGRWHLFYTGVNHAHNGKHTYGDPRQVIMHATTKSIWA